MYIHFMTCSINADKYDSHIVDSLVRFFLNYFFVLVSSCYIN